MMYCNTIDFKGKKYRYADVYLASIDYNVLIGEQSLCDALYYDHKFDSDYAHNIHNMFYCFAPDEYFDLDKSECEAKLISLCD